MKWEKVVLTYFYHPSKLSPLRKDARNGKDLFLNKFHSYIDHNFNPENCNLMHNNLCILILTFFQRKLTLIILDEVCTYIFLKIFVWTGIPARNLNH